jgi:hypothetical protein
VVERFNVHLELVASGEPALTRALRILLRRLRRDHGVRCTSARMEPR